MNDNAILSAAISSFGILIERKAKLSATCAAEDELQAPLEALIHDLDWINGLSKGAVDAASETML